VDLVEQGTTVGSSLDALIEKYVTPMLKEGADTLVPDSTHYSLLIPSIQRVCGNQLHLIETATAIARRIDHQPRGALVELKSEVVYGGVEAED
jgi:glutamate racemase